MTPRTIDPAAGGAGIPKPQALRRHQGRPAQTPTGPPALPSGESSAVYLTNLRLDRRARWEVSIRDMQTSELIARVESATPAETVRRAQICKAALTARKADTG